MSVEKLLQQLETMGKDFESFKKDNDAQLKELRAKGSVDPILKEKVDKNNEGLTALTESVEQLKKEIKLSKAKNDIETASVEEKTEKFKLYKGIPEYRQHFFDEKGNYNNESSKKYSDVLSKYMRKGLVGLNSDEREQIENYKSMNVGSDSAGGYLVRPEVGEMIVHTQVETSPWLRYVDMINISTDAIEYPTTNRRQPATRTYETGARSETTAATFGMVRIEAKEAYSRPKVTQKFLDDAAIDVEAFLAGMAGDEFGYLYNSELATGDGILTLRGILTFAHTATDEVGKVEQIAGGHASLMNDPDKFIDMQAALKPAYLPMSRWFGRRATEAVVRKMKDGEGNYLWQPGLTLAQPNTLLGHEFVKCEDMSAIGVNALPLAFGDLKHYKVVKRIGMRVLRNPYSEEPFVRFTFTERTGGNLLIHESLKLLKIATAVS